MIKIIIDGKEYSPEDAKKIFLELQQIFDGVHTEDVPYIPYIPYIPYVPEPYPNCPGIWYGYPEPITWETTSTGKELWI